MRTIHIEVDSKGITTVETKGYAGSSCVDASRFIEQALGQKTSERTTSEFYASSTTQSQQNQNSG